MFFAETLFTHAHTHTHTQTNKHFTWMTPQRKCISRGYAAAIERN